LTVVGRIAGPVALDAGGINLVTHLDAPRTGDA
jgi:hypothetical protein